MHAVPVIFFLLVSSFLSLRGPLAHAGPPEIHIHYAFSAEDEAQDNLFPLKPGGRPLPSYVAARDSFLAAAKAQGITIREFRESSTEALIASLRNPEVLGVIWSGHTQLAYQIKSSAARSAPDLEIYNAHLKDASGIFIPKGIWSGRHPGLQFIAINTCYLTEVRRYYPGSEALISPYPLEDAKLEKIPVALQSTEAAVGLRNLYGKLEPGLPALVKGLTPPADPVPPLTLSIAYRDLYSRTFVYEVLVNGGLAGILRATPKRPGGTTTFPVQVAPPFELLIRPNDAFRKSPEQKFPIDNILVDSIQVTRPEGVSKEILEAPFELGDEDRTDSSIGTFLFSNLPDLRSFPLFPERILKVREGASP